jgi:hypothetical protein
LFKKKLSDFKHLKRKAVRVTLHKGNRGSGFDKVVTLTERYQLPAPIIEATE